MIVQRTNLIIPILTLLSLSMSTAYSAEAIKKNGTIEAPVAVNRSKSNIKGNLVKPGPGTGADEHGCIAPQIWQLPSGPCVTDILPNDGTSTNGMQTE